MSKSYRIRTEVGKDKFLQVKLDQDYDKLELLSLAIFPNDVYIRDCADFGVVCGRVFSNQGLGMPNAKVSIFIPLQDEDADNPIISTLYPYKNFEQFNEDGYKYNLLPYTQSHSGHVPVGTFPDRIDALNNPNVIEVYDKYYKFTAKTNDAGDFMIFGIPVGQHDLFMQVDLSDIGEFSLTPQDLLRSGRATEAQLDGTRFKFSENYSELPQIVTLTKRIQVAPFYGQKEICDYYITRADFDLTLEAFVEIQPTAVFMGSMFSAQDKRKIRKNCKVPAKQGWLCDMIAGPGSIETIRQTVLISSDGRPILENFLLEKDGKVIDENGAWLIELPMNLDYVYTDELGNRQISPDGSRGVPTKGKYRFKVKWNQSTFINDENKRAYFLVPNIKEWGWSDPTLDPVVEEQPSENSYTLYTTTNERDITGDPLSFYVFETSSNVESYSISFSYDFGNTWIEKPEYKTIIPYPNLSPPPTDVRINYTLDDTNTDGSIIFLEYNTISYQVLSSYAFSVSWDEYGTTQMINEAINCEDRFYEFEYNKVYTVSQLLDRYTSSGVNLYLPQRTVQIKHITDNKCDGIYNQFPTNDAYYRYDVFFIIISAILTFLKFIFIPLVIVVHVLAILWFPIALIITIVLALVWVVIKICEGINSVANLLGLSIECPPEPEITLSIFNNNPFKNIKLPLILSTEDGCQACKCNIDEVDVNDNSLASSLSNFVSQLTLRNVSNLADLGTSTKFFISNPNDTGGIGAGLINLAPYVVGSNTGEYLWQNRLPLYSYQSDQYVTDVWSTQLPIVEKLNLFNTKAKFFDRDDNDYLGDFSPGDIGWNQIKVQFASDISENNNSFHYDNVLVLMLDNSTGLTQGDLLTFIKSNDSNDPNCKEIRGNFNITETVDVKFAKPKYGDGVGTTTYYMYGTSYTGEIVDKRYPDGVKTTCYPADIEYYQVIKIQKFTDYKNLVDPLYEGNRFSLPWRYLDTSKTFHNANATPSDGNNFKNGYSIIRHIRDESGSGAQCVQKISYPMRDHNASDPRTFSFDVWKYFTGSTDLSVCFLVRGVDPHSGRYKVKYDLSRLYGFESYGNSSLQVEGDFYFNIPIQATNSPDTLYGLSLTEHTFCDQNAYGAQILLGYCNGANTSTIPLFYSSYFFSYSILADANDPDNGVQAYNRNWTTTNHKYYSCLGRKFAYDAVMQQFNGFVVVDPNTSTSTDGLPWRLGYSPPSAAPSGYLGKQQGITDYDINGIDWKHGKVISVNAPNNYMAWSWRVKRPGSYNNVFLPCFDSDGLSIGSYPSTSFYGCSTHMRCTSSPFASSLPFWGAEGGGVPEWGWGGFCDIKRNDGTYYQNNYVFHEPIENYANNCVGGYWKNEYVEGGSVMMMYIQNRDLVYRNASNNTFENAQISVDAGAFENTAGGFIDDNNSGGIFTKAICPRNYEYHTYSLNKSCYWSPCYYTIPNTSSQFSSDPGFVQIEMKHANGIVFRSDRLPTSDRPNNGDLQYYGYFLQQNPGFRIFRYTGDCVSVSYGGGNSAVQQSTVDPDNSSVPDTVPNAIVLSLTDCSKAVDLNSYYINGTTPEIHVQPPYSKFEKWKWFQRGEGCYNLVSRPLVSLFPKDIGDPDGKKYSDIRTVVEWVQRTKLTLAACFDIFSHTFSNNWINGTLYAFPFQLTTFFDANNRPIKPRFFCSEIVYFNETINNFFYRSSPYDGANFIGKTKEFNDEAYGNSKNLLYPTTIMDLGPKNPYIQELVYSDVYDGYIADRIPSTTYQEISTLLNMFILSRMINSRFIELLIPTNSDDGNSNGSDDPSIKGFFGNGRWNNNNSSDLFGTGFLAGTIDGDYAQLISINSEIGVLEYNPNNYRNTDTTIGVNAGSSGTYPYLGVVFSGDNQWRDFISPRRKIWNENNSTLPILPPPAIQSYTNIPIKTQKVPFYQWNDIYADSNSIFGFQNNNYKYDVPTYFATEYQTLDRFNPSSQYFQPGTNLTKAYKGYIANYTVDANNNLTPTQSLPQNPIQPITFGAPFHFYFGLIKGSTAMDLFITKYVDTTKIYE